MKKEKNRVNKKQKLYIIIASSLAIIVIVTSGILWLVQSGKINANKDYKEPLNKNFSFLVENESTELKNDNIFTGQYEIYQKLLKEFKNKKSTDEIELDVTTSHFDYQNNMFEKICKNNNCAMDVKHNQISYNLFYDKDTREVVLYNLKDGVMYEYNIEYETFNVSNKTSNYSYRVSDKKCLQNNCDSYEIDYELFWNIINNSIKNFDCKRGSPPVTVTPPLGKI